MRCARKINSGKGKLEQRANLGTRPVVTDDAEIMRQDPSSILFVANHAFDCIGAKSYGMRTAFIDRRKRPFGQTPHQPDLVVGDFAELAAVMA